MERREAIVGAAQPHWYLIQAKFWEGPIDYKWAVQSVNLLSVWTRAAETEWLYEPRGIFISQWVDESNLEYNRKCWIRLGKSRVNGPKAIEGSAKTLVPRNLEISRLGPYTSQWDPVEAICSGREADQNANLTDDS